MIALIFAVVIFFVVAWCCVLFGAMLAGFFVGLGQLTVNCYRVLRGLPVKYHARQSRRTIVNREPVPFEVRAAVWARDGGACVYCGREDDLTVDHVVPRVLGGSNDPENLVTACRPCNSRKGMKLGPPGDHARVRSHILSLWRAERIVSRNGKH